MSAQQPFEAVAGTFLTVVESADTQSRDEFVRGLEGALVDLYAAGLTLEDVAPDDDFDVPEALTSDEAAALQRDLGKKLGEYDFYSVVFDPYDPRPALRPPLRATGLVSRKRRDIRSGS